VKAAPRAGAYATRRWVAADAALGSELDVEARPPQRCLRRYGHRRSTLLAVTAAADAVVTSASRPAAAARFAVAAGHRSALQAVTTQLWASDERRRMFGLPRRISPLAVSIASTVR
jgi:hypothetical protein